MATKANQEKTAPLPAHRSGFVAIIGKPNVGKSTLVNAFVGAKVAAVSPKPQTTRRVIHGILTRPDAQIVFVDTPGMHDLDAKTRAPLLNRVMVDAATHAIEDVDIVVFVVDGARLPTEEDKRIADLLNTRTHAPVLLAMNKMDMLKPIDIKDVTEAFWKIVKHADWMRLSATRGDNREKLLEQILARLPEGPELYPADQVTNQNLQILASEIIREQVLLKTREEVPHAVTVAIENWEDSRPDLTHIGATIYVERESHKGILIGARGGMLKEIGQNARKEIEAWVGHQIFLELWVKVWEHWRERESSLRELGYTGE